MIICCADHIPCRISTFVEWSHCIFVFVVVVVFVLCGNMIVGCVNDGCRTNRIYYYHIEWIDRLIWMLNVYLDGWIDSIQIKSSRIRHTQSMRRYDLSYNIQILQGILSAPANIKLKKNQNKTDCTFILFVVQTSFACFL